MSIVFQIHITDMYLELSWTVVADMYFPRIGSRGVHLKGNKRVGCSAFFLLFSWSFHLHVVNGQWTYLNCAYCRWQMYVTSREKDKWNASEGHTWGLCCGSRTQDWIWTLNYISITKFKTKTRGLEEALAIKDINSQALQPKLTTSSTKSALQGAL